MRLKLRYTSRKGFMGYHYHGEIAIGERIANTVLYSVYVSARVSLFFGNLKVSTLTLLREPEDAH